MCARAKKYHLHQHHRCGRLSQKRATVWCFYYFTQRLCNPFLKAISHHAFIKMLSDKCFLVTHEMLCAYVFSPLSLSPEPLHVHAPPCMRICVRAFFCFIFSLFAFVICWMNGCRGQHFSIVYASVYFLTYVSLTFIYIKLGGSFELRERKCAPEERAHTHTVTHKKLWQNLTNSTESNWTNVKSGNTKKIIIIPTREAGWGFGNTERNKNKRSKRKAIKMRVDTILISHFVCLFVRLFLYACVCAYVSVYIILW